MKGRVVRKRIPIKPITVLLVDDHALIRVAVRNLLREVGDINVVQEANTGAQAIRAVHEHRPDVVLLDLSLPGMSGVEVTQRILQIAPATKVIALTAHQDDFYSSHFLKAGARGYLTKGASATELEKAIRTVVEGKEYYITPYVAEQLALRYVQRNDPLPHHSLTPRELEVLVLISQGRKVVDIAQQFFITHKTVHAYRYRLFAKLGVRTDVELAKLALHEGFLPMSSS